MAGLFGSGASASAAMIPTVDPTVQTPPLTMRDRAAIFLRAMGGDMGGAMQMKYAPQIMAQRNALMNQVTGLLGGQPASNLDQVNAPQVGQTPDVAPTTPAVPTTDARWAKALMLAPQLGLDMNGVMKLQEMNQPHITVTPSGEAINDKSGKYEGRVFPSLDKGIIPNRGPNGELLGASALPGYADAAASIAGATTGAQEEQKAAWDLVDVPLGNGAAAKLPRAIAIPLLAKSAMRMAGGQGAPGALGGDAGQGAGGAAFGVTPTPAETTLANNRAVTQGDLEKSLPASQSALHATDNLIQQYTNQVQNILGETYDPKTGKWSPTRGAKSQVNGWSTGRLFGHIPELTGQATNLEASLDGLRALISSEKMGEVRQDSQGASNNLRLTQGEIFNIFGNLAGPLHQTQDAEALKGVLRDSVSRLRQSQSTMHTQYDQQYNQIQRPTPGATQPIPPRMGQGGRAAPSPPSRAALEAEARRRGLIK